MSSHDVNKKKYPSIDQYTALYEFFGQIIHINNGMERRRCVFTARGGSMGRQGQGGSLLGSDGSGMSMCGMFSIAYLIME